MRGAETCCPPDVLYSMNMSEFSASSDPHLCDENVKPCNVSDILQFDGNNSVLSTNSESVNSVITPSPPYLDKIAAAVHLPTVATYNMRSLFPKIGNVTADILERGISVGFFGEIWEKSENKAHKQAIETMMESEGLKYISTPRPSGWGGAAIIANLL